MKNAAYLLVACAVILCIYALNMDVTVDVGDGTRVNNIGLMSERQNYIILSGFLLVAGVIFARKTQRRQLPNNVERLYDIESVDVYDRESGNLNDEKIKSLAVSLIEKHPRLNSSDIMLVSLPVIERISKDIPDPLIKKFKYELEKWIKLYI